MNKKLYLLCLVIAISLACSVSGLVNASDEDKENYVMNTSTDVNEFFLINEEKAINIYNNILDQYRKNQTTKDNEMYSVSGIDAENYPDYFSGAYLNTDGKLVLMINQKYNNKKRENNQWYRELKDVLIDNCYVIRYANSSYSQLIDEMNWFTYSEDFKKLLDEYDLKCYGVGINDYKNLVELSLDGEKNSEFEAIIAEKYSNMFECAYDGVEDVETIGLYAGEGLTTESANFSAAFRARVTSGSSTYDAFVTCGHAFSGTTTVYIPASQTGNFNDTIIGTSPSNKQQHSGNVDAALIYTNNTTTNYNSIFLNTISLYTYSVKDLMVGAVVNKRGAKTGTTTGYVLNSAYESTGTNVPTLTDMVKTSYASAPGDSGGLAYSEIYTGNYAYAVGIHSRRAFDGSYSVYCKASRALSALGASIY